MAIEHVPHNTDVLEGSLVQFHFEFSENRGDDEEDFGFGETDGC